MATAPRSRTRPAAKATKAGPITKAARAQATRRALLDSARSLFGEQGYAATSVDEVVRHAGVTKGAMYHHFDDKDDLFRAVLEEVKGEVTAAAGRSFVEIAAAGDSMRTVLEGCFALIDASVDPRVQQITVLDARSVLDVAARRELDARYEVALLRGAFRSAMRAGSIQEQPIAPVAHIVAGALTEACAMIVEADDKDAARAEAHRVITQLLGGLRPPAADR